MPAPDCLRPKPETGAQIAPRAGQAARVRFGGALPELQVTRFTTGAPNARAA